MTEDDIIYLIEEALDEVPSDDIRILLQRCRDEIVRLEARVDELSEYEWMYKDLSE